jgi:hypothetical protein
MAAIVIDYKGKSGAAPQAKWGPGGHLQVGLYALALGALLPELRVAGGLYQPINGTDLRPRGYVSKGDDEDRADIVRTDRLEPEAADALLAAVRDRAFTAVAELRRGDIRPRPGDCAYGNEVCAHPSICRCAP